MRTENYKRNDPSEPRVTFMPQLHLQGAADAKDQAVTALAGKALPSYTESLRLAATLSIYNANHIRERLPAAESWLIKKRAASGVHNLIDAENKAADPSNPLPTVGIEVEVPRVPLRAASTIVPEYITFFDAIGMPRNRINTLPSQIHAYEFSPRPSFSAEVQARILSELLQGGFIPHLTSSTSPEDVRKYLDENLVSLHVNLGVPSTLETDIDMQRDAEKLGVALAVAYSSPLRLEHRKSKSSCGFADMVKRETTPLKKDQTYGSLRIELKAMEVHDSKTYRSIYTAQALFAALFQATMYKGGQFHSLHEGLMKDIEAIQDHFNYKPSNNIDNYNKSYEVARLAAREDAAYEMRGMLEAYARKIKRQITKSTGFEEPRLPREA